MPLELFLVLVVILGIAIVGSVIILAIGKPNPTSPKEAFEEALHDLELTGIKGIGPKRGEILKAAGVNTVSDLAVSSAKDLSKKTGIYEKIISRWLEQAKEIVK
jgi:predicted flap endonuclease-1-like 5' DNA nuclease